jgi:hypothetical protein
MVRCANREESEIVHEGVLRDGPLPFFGFYALVPIHRDAQLKSDQARLNADMKLSMPASLAREKVVSLTGCLLSYKLFHPEAGYPQSLDSLPADWKCKTKLASDANAEFTFAYATQKDATGRIADFQLTAIPKQKGVLNRDPLMTDGRGIVFVYFAWAMARETRW